MMNRFLKVVDNLGYRYIDNYDHNYLTKHIYNNCEPTVLLNLFGYWTLNIYYYYYYMSIMCNCLPTDVTLEKQLLG